MKRYLILTVTAGEGHNSISKSIANKLQENPENEVKLLDIFKTYGRPSKPVFINDGYIYACKYALTLYNMFFKMFQNAEPEKRNTSAVQTLVTYETPQLLKDIYEYKPDVIICSHFYCGIMITNLRKMYEIPAQTISILFDYTVHPFWECAIGVDYLITPSETLHPILEYKGYKPEQLVPLGIPVRQEFSEEIPKDVARKELGIDQDMFTVMVMLGGGGFGGTEKIVKKLLKCKNPVQLIVINGRDEQSKKRIDLIAENNKTNHKIVSLGFVGNVPTIMSAADVIVGKCGGVTVNESMNKRKVLILPTLLAQQEFDNMVFLSNNKSTIIYDDKYSKLPDVVDRLIDDPKVLEFYAKNIDKIRQPNALADICKFCQSFENVQYKNIEDITKKDYPKIRRQIRKINTKEQIAEIKEKNEKLKQEKKTERQVLKDAKQELKEIKESKKQTKAKTSKSKTSKSKTPVVRSLKAVRKNKK